MNFHDVNVTGGSARADKSAKKLPKVLTEIICERGHPRGVYLPELVL